MSRTRFEWWAETEKDPTYLAAADWLVRLRNPEVTLEETLAWQQWMQENAKHARTFARVEEISQLMPQVRAPKAPSARALARDRYDASVSLKEWPTSSRSNLGYAVAASIALVGCALFVIRSAPTMFGNTAGIQILTTAVGENRTVALGDGSTITLGGGTRVAVSFTDDSRALELEHGEALFTVARDPKRPFKVHAGDAIVVALGTAFNIRRSSDHAVVSVTEGRVRVEPVSRLIPAALLREFKPQLRPLDLKAGEQTSASAAGIEKIASVEDPATATSWRSGQLTFRLQPLRYVLEDVNRYASKPIVLADDSLGSLTITGMVTRENVEGWIQSLERGFSLRAVEQEDRIVLDKR